MSQCKTKEKIQPVSAMLPFVCFRCALDITRVWECIQYNSPHVFLSDDLWSNNAKQMQIRLVDKKLYRKLSKVQKKLNDLQNETDRPSTSPDER